MITAARIDKNQPEIVDRLRKAGCSVQILSEVGKGVPDILVGFRGFNFLFEIKGVRGKLTPNQVEWFDSWKGDVIVIRSFEEAEQHILSRLSPLGRLT